jgi:hypothetical protein
LVKVVNKIQYLLFEICLRGKTASTQELACEDAKPDFNLIEPGTVLWGKMENNFMGGIG